MTRDRLCELFAYIVLMVLMVLTLNAMLATEPAPAHAPLTPSHSTCENAAEVLSDVSQRVGEDIRPITTLGVKDMRLDFLAYEQNEHIYMSDRVRCDEMRDLLLHEFAHVLQSRVDPMRSANPDLEVEADIIAETFGAQLQPYIDWYGYAPTTHNHDRAHEVLDRTGK